MEPLVARRSIRQYSWALVVAIAFMLVSYKLGMPRGANLLLTALIAAGPAAVGLIRAALGQDAILRIDEAGVTDQRIGVGPIAWGQITTVQRTRNRLYVGVEDPAVLGNSDTLCRKMNRPLGKKQREQFGVYIHLQGLDIKADRIAAAINEHICARDRSRV